MTKGITGQQNSWLGCILPHTSYIPRRAGASSPVGPVLAGPIFKPDQYLMLMWAWLQHQRPLPDNVISVAWKLHYLNSNANDSACRCFEHGGLVCLTMMNLSALSIVAKFLHLTILLNELTTCITVRIESTNWFWTSSTTVLSTRFWQLFWTQLIIVLDENLFDNCFECVWSFCPLWNSIIWYTVAYEMLSKFVCWVNIFCIHTCKCYSYSHCDGLTKQNLLLPGLPCN